MLSKFISNYLSRNCFLTDLSAYPFLFKEEAFERFGDKIL